MNWNELQDLVIVWAWQHDLINLDGTPKNTTPKAQAVVTLEEINEATTALRRWLYDPDNEEAAFDLALERGDVLVTLCIQSAFQGQTLARCIELSQVIPDSELGLLTGLGRYFYTLVSNGNHRVPVAIGAIARLIAHECNLDEDFAFDAQDCLWLAIQKISTRKTTIVNGKATKVA